MGGELAFQNIFLREDLNPNGKEIQAVIIACIFGVCSSGGQCEESLMQFADNIREKFPDVAKFVITRRYVDDFLKSLKSKETAMKLMKDTELTLRKELCIEMKGWCMSGEKPIKELRDDGTCVKLAGMTWFPELDGFMLNVNALHFGKKKCHWSCGEDL